MKLLLVLAGLAVVSAQKSTIGFSTRSAEESCYKDINTVCSKDGGDDPAHCNANYGSFSVALSNLNAYVNMHIERSYDYLLMASYFGSSQADRPGFHRLYMGLSDSLWEQAIHLIQYITKRGGTVDFSARHEETGGTGVYEVSEIASIAKALDMHKKLATEAHRLHKQVARNQNEHHDPEVASYIEEHFVHQHARIIRELAGHSNDLRQLITGQADSSLAYFIFDEYLAKL